MVLALVVRAAAAAVAGRSVAARCRSRYRHVLPLAVAGIGGRLRLPVALRGIEAAAGAGASPGWRRVLALCAWALLVTAAARPQWVGDIESLPRSGRDLLLAVDASGSMSTEDMTLGGRGVSRYAAVKIIAGDFIRR